MNWRIINVLTFLFTLLAYNSSFAIGYTFTGGGGDDLWSNANNWTPTGVPGVGDDVTINSGTVDLDISIICPGIESLAMSGGRMESSTLNTLEVDGGFTWTGGTIADLQLDILSTGTISGPSTKTITDEAWVVFGHPSSMTGGLLHITESANFDAAIEFTYSGGEIRLSEGGGFSSVDIEMDFGGNVTAGTNPGIFFVDLEKTGAGTGMFEVPTEAFLTVKGGSLVFQQGISPLNQLNFSNNASIEIAGGSTVIEALTWRE